MRLSSLICAAFLTLSACETAGLIREPAHPDLAGRDFYSNFVCGTVGEARIWAESLEQSQSISRAVAGLLSAGVCVRVRSPRIATVERWIETITDWEGDEAYIVQYRNQTTGEAGDLYGVVWPVNEVGEDL